MSDKRTHFKKLLNTLFENCFQGIVHIRIWQDLDEALMKDSKVYSKYSLFWLTTLKAQLEAAQLHLIKLFDKSSKSISMDYLIRYAEKNRDIFDKGNLESLEVEINFYNEEIKEFEELKKNLLDIRNKHFIHLSKQHMENYNKFYIDYSTVRENIYEMFLICEDLLTGYNDLCGFEQLKPIVTGREDQTKKLLNALSS